MRYTATICLSGTRVIENAGSTDYTKSLDKNSSFVYFFPHEKRQQKPFLVKNFNVENRFFFCGRKSINLVLNNNMHTQCCRKIYKLNQRIGSRKRIRSFGVVLYTMGQQVIQLCFKNTNRVGFPTAVGNPTRFAPANGSAIPSYG